MLKKLFKYDFISTGRSISLFAIICLCVSMVGAGAMKLNTIIDQGDYNVFTSSLTAILTVLTVVSFMVLFAFFVVCVILILRRYYTNLFTDEGYLTFTLPVKTSQILTSKILSGYVWYFLSAIVSVVSMFVLICVGTAPVGSILNEEIFIGVKWIFQDLTAALPSFIENVIYICVFLIFGVLFNLLYMYLSITIGSIIANKHKILAAIGLYFGINTVYGMLVSVFTIVLSYATDNIWFPTEAFTRAMFIGQIIIIIVLDIVAYKVNNSLLKKRLNLQ